MDKVIYISFYSDPSGRENRKGSPAGDAKAEYTIASLRAIGYEVEVISMCQASGTSKVLETYEGYTIDKDGIKVHFLPTVTSKNRLLRVFLRWLTWPSRKAFIDAQTKGCSAAFLYHSLHLNGVLKFLERKKTPIVLEINEIYSDVVTKFKNVKRKRELSMFHRASAYILSTEMLKKYINANKPYAVCSGTYLVEDIRKSNVRCEDTSGEIHCVYAGTLDPRKGGAVAAAAAAAFLPENYHVHILGFGSETEVHDMVRLVGEIQAGSKAEVSYDGVLTGEKFIEFIQSCDIGLSTQNPDAEFNHTSFPSKVLMYLANGLRVVSIRIPAISNSEVGEILTFYDVQSPECIAQAIKKVPVDECYDSRDLINQLNKKFKEKLSEMLQMIKVKSQS